MGRLREKLDDDLPELTGGLVSMIWPHYLRTIPSLSIVEFTADWRELKNLSALKKALEFFLSPLVKSAPAVITPRRSR